MTLTNPFFYFLAKKERRTRSPVQGKQETAVRRQEAGKRERRDDGSHEHHATPESSREHVADSNFSLKAWNETTTATSAYRLGGGGKEGSAASAPRTAGKETTTAHGQLPIPVMMLIMIVVIMMSIIIGGHHAMEGKNFCSACSRRQRFCSLGGRVKLAEAVCGYRSGPGIIFFIFRHPCQKWPAKAKCMFLGFRPF